MVTRDAGSSPATSTNFVLYSVSNNDAIRLAALRGYKVDALGRVLSPRGKYRKLRAKTKNGVIYFTFNIDPYLPPVAVHRLVAFQKFGDEALRPKIQTRHLNSNSLDNAPDNIAIGTQTQNMLDCAPAKRKEHAAKGFQTYTAEFVRRLRQEYVNGLGYKLLRAKYGVPLATLSYYLSGTAKKQSFTYPLT